MEEKTKEYKPVTSTTEILNEIKYILETNKNIDENSNHTPIIFDETCISLDNIYTCIINEKQKFKTVERTFGQLIKDCLQNHFAKKVSVIFYGFNFNKDEISIGFDKDDKWDHEEIIFAKYNDDVYLKSSKSEYGQEIFRISYEIISNAYDELIKFKSYDQETSYSITSMNSNFYVNISQYQVSIFDSSDITAEFKLKRSCFNDLYTCECNSGIVLNTVNGIESEIFKNTFVKIEDCPSWMKHNLYEMRKNELEEQKQKKMEINTDNDKEKIEEKNKKKKSKLLSLFNWTKK